MRTLIKNVYVDYTWWGPAHGNADQVPAEVAERITNPDVWADAPDPVAETVAPPAAGPRPLAQWLAEAPIEEIVRLATMAPDDAESWVAGILDAAGDRRDEITTALEAGAAPVPAVVDDITALDDDALVQWLSDHKADEVFDAYATVLAGDVTTDADKATFTERLIAAEAAGKDRKGIAEHLTDALERLAPDSDGSD